MPNRSVNFTIGANISKLEKNLSKAQKRFRNFGYKMQRTGRKLTQNISVPIAIAGGASLKLASDFESSMTRIQTLVGLSVDSVDKMKQSVLSLSNQTGRSSKELSEALFTVTSAGLRGEQALQVLENSAKASATGLGRTREIAKATTSVLQAYGKENITASEATDTLLKTVRAGNLEASELAPVLGRVIGIASTLDVSFQEVGANIATFTRLGVSSEEAVTGLRSAMNAFIKPSKQAKDTLAEVGLSMEGMRKKIREDGLANALQFLVTKFDGNVEALGNVIPNVRALSNVLGTAGSQGKEYAEIVDQIKNSTDGVNKAFEETAKTTAFKFKKSLEKLKNQGIELGSKLLPVANKIIDKVSDMADTFASFSDDTKENILIVAGALAVGGPLLMAIGSASKGISSLIGGFKNLIKFGKFLYLTALPKLKTAVVSLTNVMRANPILAVAGAITAVGTAAYFARQKTNKFKESLEDTLSANIKNLSLESLNKQIDQVEEKIQGFEDLKTEYGSLDENTKKRFEYYKNAYDELYKKRQRLVMQNFKKSLEDESSSTKKPEITPVETPTKSSEPMVTNPFYGRQNPIDKNTNVVAPDITGETNKFTGNIAKMKASLGSSKEKLTEFQQNLVNDVAPVINNGLSDIGSSFVDMSIQSAIAGKSFGNVFKTLLTSLGDLAVRVGKIAIATGIAIEGIKKALQSLNPFAAIAAGGALIALGYGVKTQLSNSVGGGNSGGLGSTPSTPSLTNTDAQRITLSVVSNGAQYSIQKAFERALANARLKASGSDLVLAINNNGYTNR